MRNEELKQTPSLKNLFHSSFFIHNSSFLRRWLIFFILAIAALAVRLPELGQRPMHTDEAINAYIIGQILAGKSFQYDPQDRHGPALAAFTLPIVRAQGVKSFSELTESQLRLAPVLAGIITVLLFGAGVEMFGFIPCLVAAILFAFAPIAVYYNRYFIHETFFVAATFGFILSGWRAAKFKSIFFAALAGFCAALMLACKETAAIHFFALAIAGLIFCFWNQPKFFFAKFFQSKIIFTALAIFIFITILLFSWFGQNWHNLAELFRAAPHLAARAGGEGHEKPFWYYAILLGNGWSGLILCVLATVGILISILNFTRQKKNSPAIFLLIYALIIFVIYSAIPYKTPWLAFNFYLPLAIFAGIAIEKILRRSKTIFTKTVFSICTLLFAVAIFHDTQKWIFQKPADEKNPYAYAHTSEDLLQLPARLAEMAQQNKIMNPKIAIVANDAWPLPWYLRKFSQVGFWQPDQKIPSADFFITSPEAAQKMDAQLKTFRPEFFGIRPNVLIILWSPTNSP
jgi:uncharacterized protein (TIGR03663 family)